MSDPDRTGAHALLAHREATNRLPSRRKQRNLRRPRLRAPVLLTAAAIALPALCLAGDSPPAGDAGTRREQQSAGARADAPTPQARPAPVKAVRCAAPGGEPIEADAVLRDLHAGKDVDLVGRTIVGSLEVETLWPAAADDRKSALRVVRGRMRLESCLVQGRVSFPRSVLAKGLDLTCTEIRGDLDLTDSEVQGAGVAAPRARILGSARLTRLSVAGPIALPGATIEEGVEMWDVRASGGIDLAGGDLKRDVEISRAVVAEIDLSAARVGGQASMLDLLVLGDLAATDAGFAKGMRIDGARILGRIDLGGARAAGGFFLSSVSVGGDLFLDLAGDPSVTIAGLEVDRDLSFLDGGYGNVTIERARVHGLCEMEGARFRGKLVIRDSDLGEEFSAAEAWFGGDCELRRVRIPGEDPLQGALFARAPTLIETFLPRPPTVQSSEEEEGEVAEGDEDPEDLDGENPP